MSLAMLVKGFCFSVPTGWNLLSDSCKHDELLSTFRTGLTVLCSYHDKQSNSLATYGKHANTLNLF